MLSYLSYKYLYVVDKVNVSLNNDSWLFGAKKCIIISVKEDRWQRFALSL